MIPVNAQGDLDNVWQILGDLAGYGGRHRLELVLVVNNYPDGQPPPALAEYRLTGATVVAIPDVRRPGEAVGFSARIPGIRAASSEVVLTFDADCRVPHPGSLIDWYVSQFEGGADCAYTHVAYYQFRERPSIRARFVIHHTSRWFKRVVLRIPTNRGSNYAVRRTRLLELYDEGMLADEINVGPTIKACGGSVAYSGQRKLTVLTSGRMFSGGWFKLVRYFAYRLRYNWRVLPVRRNVAAVTGRESDPVRRYVDNRPIK